jgi:hypothetical protein
VGQEGVVLSDSVESGSVFPPYKVGFPDGKHWWFSKEELQLKQKENQNKQQKLVVDGATSNYKLDIERERIAVQERIAGMNVGAKIATDKANLSAKQQEAKLRIGVDIAREMAQEARTTAQGSKPEETE